MKKLYVFLVSVLVTTVTTQAHASNTVRVKALGSSPRGQYVAFEEFGYKNGRTMPFSKIRIMNVWKNKYADKTVQVIGKNNEVNLAHVRHQAKTLAKEQLDKFNISI